MRVKFFVEVDFVGDNFAGFEDIEVSFVAEGSFGAELADYGDVLGRGGGRSQNHDPG